MREILFRGKRVDNGEWAYGCLYQRNNRYFIIIDKLLDHFEIIPETVGQFTGLLDNNGVKIFEGDIIQSNYRNQRATKGFGESKYIGCGVKLMGVILMYDSGEVVPFMHESGRKDWEVIGNIHEEAKL